MKHLVKALRKVVADKSIIKEFMAKGKKIQIKRGVEQSGADVFYVFVNGQRETKTFSTQKGAEEYANLVAKR
jgi:hypothetical protein